MSHAYLRHGPPLLGGPPVAGVHVALSKDTGPVAEAQEKIDIYHLHPVCCVCVSTISSFTRLSGTPFQRSPYLSMGIHHASGYPLRSSSLITPRTLTATSAWDIA